jgi:hypothetical protein
MSPLISLSVHQSSTEFARYKRRKFVFGKSFPPDSQSLKSYYAAAHGTELFQEQNRKRKEKNAKTSKQKFPSLTTITIKGYRSRLH